MRFTLDITMANAEGALERILGRLRQRGFSLFALNAGVTADGALMNVRITLESERTVELAVKQLSKLLDVDDVQLINEELVIEPFVAAAARQHASHPHVSHSHMTHHHAPQFGHAHALHGHGVHTAHSHPIQQQQKAFEIYTHQ